MVKPSGHAPDRLIALPWGGHAEVHGELAAIIGNCILTGNEHRIMVPTTGLLRWLGGERVQDALPDLSAESREFLMSGVSPQGWPFGDSETET